VDNRPLKVSVTHRLVEFPNIAEMAVPGPPHGVPSLSTASRVSPTNGGASIQANGS
jgi:hypothetical protein